MSGRSFFCLYLFVCLGVGGVWAGRKAGQGEMLAEEIGAITSYMTRCVNLIKIFHKAT